MKEKFQNILLSTGLKFSFRSDAEQLWDQVWEKLDYQSLRHSEEWATYQKLYFQSQGAELTDLSIVLMSKDGSTVARMPLDLVSIDGSLKITSAGMDISYPCFIKTVSENDKKHISHALIKALIELSRQLNIEELVFEIPPCISGYQSLELTVWQITLAKLGCRTEVRNSLVIDLTKSLNEIRLGFRKSYKPLITSGLKAWHHSIIDSENSDEQIWESFKALHFSSAGHRKTRSNQTWDIQYNMIKQGTAVLICLFDPNDRRLIGGGFFQYTRQECIYAVAAYDRTMFAKPIGHVVQWLAIERLKSIGIQHYIIGERFMPERTPSVSDKEISISHFKEGFTKSLFPNFVLRYLKT